jgi:hypothetical protein
MGTDRAAYAAFLIASALAYVPMARAAKSSYGWTRGRFFDHRKH